MLKRRGFPLKPSCPLGVIKRRNSNDFMNDKVDRRQMVVTARRRVVKLPGSHDSSRGRVIRVLRVYDNVAAVCPLFNHLRLSNTHRPLPTIQPCPRRIRNVRDEHTIFTRFRADGKRGAAIYNGP